MPTNPEVLPQRASRRTPLYDDLLIVAVIWAMVVIVYHLPLSALTLDDYTVLPERAAMSNNADWLVHLVSFDQSRLTAGA